MINKIKLTNHAILRQTQFPNLNIIDELKTSVEIGGQKGSSKAYLCKSDVVAIVDNDCVITILTKNQYLANLQMVHKNNVNTFSLLTGKVLPELTKEEKLKIEQDKIRQKREASASKKREQQKEFERKQILAKQERIKELRKQIMPIVIADVHTDIANGMVSWETRKDRHRALKALGYKNSQIEHYENFYSEYRTSLVKGSEYDKRANTI